MTDTAPPPALNDLSAREQQLIEAARSGSVLTCSRLRGHLLVTSSMPEHLIRADVIRELLMGHYGQLDPRGIRLWGAHIVGQLDLDYISTGVGLELIGCAFAKSITARGAHLRRLALTASHISALKAAGLRLDGNMSLDQVQLTGRDVGIQLFDAHIGGVLDCAQLHTDSANGPAMVAARLRVGSNFRLANARFTGNGELGAVRLDGAHIGGQVNANAMHIDNSTGPALQADGMQIDGDLFLTKCRFTSNSEFGAVRLFGAHIGGHVNANAMRIDNSTGPALNGSSLQVNGNLALPNGRFTGNGESGAVRLHGAHISGQVNATATHINNSTGPALQADGMQIDDDLVLANGRFTGNGESGAVRLLGAHIDGQLAIDATHINNPTGPALNADFLQVKTSVYLTKGRFTGNGELGAVRLLGAHIDGQLAADATHINNPTGPALNAEYLQVKASVYLTGAQLAGSGLHDAIRLHSAQIGGQLAFAGARIINGSAPGIELEEAKVAGTVFLPVKLVCPQPWGRSCPRSRHIVLDGFTFNGMAATDWREWLHLIRFHTTYYSPSPYQQLAASERAAGHDGNARHILIAQQQDLYRLAPKALGGRLTRSFHLLWGLLGGYGYRARRTAAALLFTLVAAGGLGLWAGHVETNPGYAAERTAASGSPSQQCTPVELIGLGLDRGLPLAPTGLRTRCDLDTATTSGQVFTVAVWIIQAAIWGLATLALAGYTGLVRKPA